MNTRTELKVVPFGGLGRVGGNMMVYETQDDLIVVDCGVLFPNADQPGVDFIVPDIAYVLQQKHKLRAVVLTHGHEDHLGALVHIVHLLQVPVYATRCTLALLRLRFGERDHQPEFRELHDLEDIAIGSFGITPIAVAHSIPDSVALLLHTPVGTIVHTGDFKFEDNPLDGRKTDAKSLRAAGDNGVLALFSDSTNAQKKGHTVEERHAGHALYELIQTAPQRVCITAFASNMFRLQQIIEAADRLGRHVIVAGRSMQQNVQLAYELGLIKTRHSILKDMGEFATLDPSRVVVLAGGTQGEPDSTMSRVARNRHGQIKLEPGDRVIFSSRRIPGNERAIGNVINSFCNLGCEVIDDQTNSVHASGHAYQEEQTKMIELLNPQYFVPIHGEYRHLLCHATLAENAGIPRDNIALISDGQVVQFLKNNGHVAMLTGEHVPSGHVFVQGKILGQVDETILKDRRKLGAGGAVVCVVCVNKNGKLEADPLITMHGVVKNNNEDVLERAGKAVLKTLEHKNGTLEDCGDDIRIALKRFFRKELDLRPLVLPMVIRVGSAVP